MCKCTPEIRTPFCGKPGCEWPVQSVADGGAALPLHLPAAAFHDAGMTTQPLKRGSVAPQYVGESIVGYTIEPSSLARPRLHLPHTDIARVAHEVNRAYCRSIGDDSQPAWEDAPDWQKDSAISGVRYHLAHPDSTPADSHNSWLAEKEAAGWTYGPVKDPELKQHPCFVPYDELPPAQRTKDYLFLAVVRALAVGLTIDV